MQKTKGLRPSGQLTRSVLEVVVHVYLDGRNLLLVLESATVRATTKSAIESKLERGFALVVTTLCILKQCQG